MKKLTGILLILGVFLTSVVTAQQELYIEVSDGCYDQYVYSDSDGKKTEALSYIDEEGIRIIYQLNEKKETRYRAPSSMIQCGDVRFTKALINSIRNGSTSLSFVERSQSGRGFQIATVSNLIELDFADNYMAYKDNRMDFTYDFRPTKSNVNLSNPGSGSRIYFDEAVNFNCPRQFRFKQVFDAKGNDYQYFTIAEHIGLTEVTQPPRPPITVASSKSLSTVNGRSVKMHYKIVCKRSDAKPSTVAYDDSGKPIRTTPSDEPWSEGGQGRIYRDLNSGMYIDRKTWTVANLEYGGFLYVNGKQYAPDDPNAPSLDGTLASTADEQARSVQNCNFSYDSQIQLFIDRTSGLPANGICNGNTYKSGRLINNNAAAVADPNNCYVYRDPNGLYINGRNGEAANITCDGKTYVNGQLVNQAAAPTQNPNRHTVKKGETMYSIARRYGLSVAQLQTWNSLDTGATLLPGQSLIISSPTRPTPSSYEYVGSRSVTANRPSATPSEYGRVDADIVPVSSYETQVSGTSQYEFHTVGKRETLSGIAKEYNMTIAQIRALNDMSDWEIIYPGQQLRVNKTMAANTAATSQARKLPDAYDASSGRVIVTAKSGNAPSPTQTTYVVKKGDTLSKIARKYNMSVAELKMMNGLKSDLIYPDDTLKVTDR